MYRGLLLNETVAIQRKTTLSDSACGKIPVFTAHIARYHCRIYHPDAETLYADEGERQVARFMMIGQLKDIQTGDKVIRSGGSEMIVTMAKRPRGQDSMEYMKCWVREIKVPPTRPGQD